MLWGPRAMLLRQLLQQRHLTTHVVFAAQYDRAAARLAEPDRDLRLASLKVSPRQFDRWYDGELLTLPRPDACRVLEHMLPDRVTSTNVGFLGVNSGRNPVAEGS